VGGRSLPSTGHYAVVGCRRSERADDWCQRLRDGRVARRQSNLSQVRDIVKISVYPRIVCGEFSILHRFRRSIRSYQLIDGMMKRRSTLQCGPALHHAVDLLIRTYAEPFR